MNIKNTISLIEELTNLHKFRILKLEEILGSKFLKEENENDNLDWLLEEHSSAPEIYLSNMSNKYPQIKKIKFETMIIDKNTKEYFLSISLRENNFINIDSIINNFGPDHKFVTQAENVPDDKRCYIEYHIKDKLLTLGFQTCRNLKEISKISLRLN